MLKECTCYPLKGKPEEFDDLVLLSAIPSQRVYRCSQCQSFLCYREDSGSWEVLLPGNIESEIKTLYADTSA